MSRKWSVYEKNQLAKYGISVEVAAGFGQMPVEYITGHVEFRGLDLKVTSDVLIPRVETEQLVELCIQALLKKQESKKTLNIADVGTGSGAIGISLAKWLEENIEDCHSKIWMSDRSSKALEIAKQNLSQLTRSRVNVDLFESDLFNEYPVEQKFDLIVANLPYIPTVRVQQLDESVKNFEPEQALDGGPDGLQTIKRFLKQAKAKISANGTIVLEVDESHKLEDFENIMNELGVKWTMVVIPDWQGLNRFVKFDC